MGLNAEFWRGRRVLLTGHTGFKGGWLSLMLSRLGAKVTGYALAPTPGPSLFVAGRVESHLQSVIGDIRDLASLRTAVEAADPEIILHLAAQSLVLTSYEMPSATFETNVMGTANVLEVARTAGALRTVVTVTSDKVYRNREWRRGYREDDELGGRDPYSCSKACAELVSTSYRDSFLAARGVASATARAGNVIGGGDWAPNRIVPDFVRAVSAGQKLWVRNPASVRPWQHVLEPLEGYLMLAERMATDSARYSRAWNFGPPPEAVRSVGQLADDLVARWGEAAGWAHEPVTQPHEATLLMLDATAARQDLDWAPRLDYERAIDFTVTWYQASARSDNLERTTLDQIDSYFAMSPLR